MLKEDVRKTAMTTKQKLVLFFVYMDFAKSGYDLIKHFDKADFPAKLDENLKPLLDNDFIVVSKLLYNGTPSEYSITEKGRNYFANNFDEQEILNYIWTLDNPEHIIEITKALLKRRSA